MNKARSVEIPPSFAELHSFARRSRLQQFRELNRFRWEDLMYCPRCGQQFMGEVRFCSRCGISLNVIAAITSRDGLITTADSNVAFAKRPPRQKGMRVGAMLML